MGNDSSKPSLSAIGTDDEVAYWNDVAAQAQARNLRRNRREALKSFALVLAAPMVASGWIAREISPRVEQRVEFIPMREDGTIALSVRVEDMSPEAQKDMAINTAWYYVYLRESFSSGMASHAWRIVSLMSDARVQREYQEAHIASNPQSPWARYNKDNIIVSVEKDSYFDLIPPTGYEGPPPGYGFRYTKTISDRSGVTSRSTWQSTLQFHRNVPSINARERREFNAPGIIVWEYPPPQQLGASQGGSR